MGAAITPIGPSGHFPRKRGKKDPSFEEDARAGR
jgi:hypothetical protein